ncbi:hypothetical protein F4X73_15045 [Candidatus Poribacteria bacterium]|nr:hypothetical protein [Candidatus Poribacteria bacterium]MYB66005.1 hypothetical protein [Candidatus Poribacteria bacterium]
MNLNKIRKNTLIILLLCVVVIGSIGVIDVLHAKWWQAPVWLVKMWNAILKLEETQKGRLALIAALENEKALAGDEIAELKEQINNLMGRRNRLAEQNLPNEQEKTRAAKAANDALDAYNKARSEAKRLREEIAELEAKLLRTSPSDEMYSSIEFAINLKKSSLADAEEEMKTEKAKYNAEKQAYRDVIYSLSYTTKIDQINRLTYQITTREAKVAALQKKIVKLQKEITDVTNRRVEVDVEIDEKKKKWYQLEKDAKNPGPQID